MKRIISLLFILICFSSVLLTTGCGTKHSQEEFRAEYIEKLNSMSVKKNTDREINETGLYLCDKVADDLVLFSGLLELFIHCYEIYEPDREIITYDEIVGLYSSYDDDVYNRFNELYKWYCTANGSAAVDFYRQSMIKANNLYIENFGESFFPSDRELDWTIEQRISFEDFIRRTPDFMPMEEYEKELAYLGIK